MAARGSWISALAVVLLAPGDAMAEVPDVVASVKPIHSLVAGIMAGVGEPALLVKGNASPHDYALKPSDAAALENADLVFWVGEGFELFLVRPLQSIADEGRVVELAETPGLVLLPPREGGLWEPHLDEHSGAEHDEDENHGHGAFDGHLWLDPHNAKLMTARIADALAERDPEHSPIYRANRDALQARLDALDAELATRLESVRGVPFIVFHDAYQYFEKRYRLAGVGSITVNHEQPPGAGRLLDIQEKIAA
ncbi:MAG: zinc ABC transporter substrate-binding protein, partial [Dongiaceae bacterium]